MGKDEIKRLLQLYLSNYRKGKDTYFDSNEIEELLDSFENEEDYTYYDDILELGLKLHPEDSGLLIRKCKVYIFHEDYENALNLLNSISDTDNEDGDAVRVECYCMLDGYEKAVSYIEQLEKKDCDYLEGIFEDIAPLLNDSDMEDEANDFIRRGLKLFPDNIILMEELCYNLENKGELDEAIQICNKLIDINPYSYDYWFLLGRLYSSIPNYDKAIEALDFAITCDTLGVEAKSLKAYCLYMNGNYQKAIDAFNEVPSDEDGEIHDIPWEASCYIKLEDFENAYKLLHKLFEKRGRLDKPSTYINYMRSCMELGKEDEAHQMLLKAAEHFPNDIHILSLMILDYLKSNDSSKIMEISEQLFNILGSMKDKDPGDIKLLMMAAEFLCVKGKVNKAIEYYHKILDFKEEVPNVFFQLAMAYLIKGDMEHFDEYFMKLSPDELLDCLEKHFGIDVTSIINDDIDKHIPPEDLVKEFLNNKDNNN
jgi:tetratricopeptide (TPR) repeat protein